MRREERRRERRRREGRDEGADDMGDVIMRGKVNYYFAFCCWGFLGFVSFVTVVLLDLEWTWEGGSFGGERGLKRRFRRIIIKDC